MMNFLSPSIIPSRLLSCKPCNIILPGLSPSFCWFAKSLSVLIMLSHFSGGAACARNTFAFRRSVLSCMTKILFGAFQSYWPQGLHLTLTALSRLLAVALGPALDDPTLASVGTVIDSHFNLFLAHCSLTSFSSPSEMRAASMRARHVITCAAGRPHSKRGTPAVFVNVSAFHVQAPGFLLSLSHDWQMVLTAGPSGTVAIGTAWSHGVPRMTNSASILCTPSSLFSVLALTM